jgi:hypothetical protein
VIVGDVLERVGDALDQIGFLDEDGHGSCLQKMGPGAGVTVSL